MTGTRLETRRRADPLHLAMTDHELDHRFRCAADAYPYGDYSTEPRRKIMGPFVKRALIAAAIAAAIAALIAAWEVPKFALWVGSLGGLS